MVLRHILIRSIVATLVALWPLPGVVGGNVTVDDADSAIYYTPNHWNANVQSCAGCSANPDPSHVYQATWHDSTSHVNDPTIILQYTFTGTDLYIYGILWDNPRYRSNVDLTLSIDGSNHYYKHAPTGTSDSYEYNKPVFSLHNLENQLHTFQVTLNTNSNFLFDYLIYTYEESATSVASTSFILPSSSETVTSSTTSASSTTSPSSVTAPLPSFSLSIPTSARTSTTATSLSSISTPPSSSSHPGTIAGIVIGALVIIAVLASLVGFICYRRGRRQRHPHIVLPTAPSESVIQSDPPWSVPSTSYPPTNRAVATSVATWSEVYRPPSSIHSISRPITTPPAYWEVYNDGSSHSDITGGPDSGTAVTYLDNPTSSPSTSEKR